MNAAQRFATLTTCVALAATSLTALTTTPATAAVKCLKTQTKTDTGVKITYRPCTDGNGRTRLTGTLTDTKEDGFYAVANVRIGDWSMGVKTGSSKYYSTGFRTSGSIGITIFRS
ncbi:hypothetical protein RKD29_002768 [Streptomyces tendae]|uniref:hypothetical protein n=1 Tax=Streptomyces tendae TaxID=1932 RepID=UPI003838CE94